MGLLSRRVVFDLNDWNGGKADVEDAAFRGVICAHFRRSPNKLLLLETAVRLVALRFKNLVSRPGMRAYFGNTGVDCALRLRHD